MTALDNDGNNGNTVAIMLLPLASEPFTAPIDRDMLPSERRTFVRTHRTCVYGYRRRNDGPAMSIVYYVPTDDDELLVDDELDDDDEITDVVVKDEEET